MPANDGRHGPKSRRTSIKTISIAAAAIGALALAACTSTTTSPPVPATPAAATGTGTGADSAGTLTGAGSTYVAPFFALRRLRRAHERQRAGSRQRRPGHPGARRPGRRRRGLQPGPPLNPAITLPPAPITVVHRSDGSGTTYIFSNYLTSVDPAWAAKVGTGKTLNWPAGEGAEGNGGVTSTVFRTPWSIGYVEQAYSQDLVLPFAEVRNQAGNYVLPSTQTIAYAAANLYVPLPSQVRQLALTMLQQVTGPAGAHLLS